MIRTVSSLLVITLICGNVLAQTPDFTYKNPDLAGKSAAFTAKKTTFSFSSTTNGKAIELQMPLGTDPSSWLQTLKTWNQPKLTAEDLVFLQLAFNEWKKVERNLGFTVLPSGLAYKVSKEGSGKQPEKGKKVKVHYKGYLEDGKVFDNSFDRGQPIEITLGVGQVIKGWDEGIGLFKVGGTGTLKIPADLGYGARGAGGVIPPNATLYFDIEVVEAE